jgi:hypothetical protein
MDNRDEGRQLALDLPDHLRPDLVMDSTAKDAEQSLLPAKVSQAS